MPVWNSKAIDYSKGVRIYNPDTGIYYTEEQARLCNPETNHKLCLKANKIGCYVMTNLASEVSLKKRGLY